MQIPPIRVALIEDRHEIRDGLREMIAGSAGFKCCGAYGSMEETLPNLGEAVPDVVLVDIGLPGMSGVQGIREIRRRSCSTAFAKWWRVVRPCRRKLLAECWPYSARRLRRSRPITT